MNLGDVSSVEDLESGVNIPVATEQFRDHYRQLVAQHRSALEKKFGASRIDYIFTDISQPLDDVLFRYLSDRQRQIRTR